MADRIGVINRGEIIVVVEKATLMRKLGKKQLTLQLSTKLAEIPGELKNDKLTLSADGLQLAYTFDSRDEHTGVAELIKKIGGHGIDFKNLQTKESSLEDIFVDLIGNQT
jgi:ABC-2 type transport system ATP-binding protein